MHYIEFFRRLQDLTQPRSYLEIGVRWGDSLVLANCPAIGVDPEPALNVSLPKSTRVVATTSDDFFADPSHLSAFPGGAVDLAFIDGMHLSEFALRDFMNVERLGHPGTVVLLDDVLPRSSREASRKRKTVEWTGDVWRMIPTLRDERPDLVVIQVATRPTGLLLVLGLDPTSTRLAERYEGLLSAYQRETDVPSSIIGRTRAVDPEALLAAPFWPALISLRTHPEGKAGLVRDAVEWQPPGLTAAQIDDSKQSPLFDRRLQGRTERTLRRGLSRLRRSVH